MQETQVRSLGQEDALENGMATHSNILAWKISRQRSLVGYSPWGHKASDTEHSTQTHLEDVMLSGISQPKTNAI